MPHRVLTPPGTWSYSILNLLVFYCWEPKIVMYYEFCKSFRTFDLLERTRQIIWCRVTATLYPLQINQNTFSKGYKTKRYIIAFWQVSSRCTRWSFRKVIPHQGCKIQKNWRTVTVALTIEHHGGHSRTPANQRWDQVPGRSQLLILTKARTVCTWSNILCGKFTHIVSKRTK